MRAPRNTGTDEKKAPYVVSGSDIWTSEGRAVDGATVYLTPSEARHFIKIGRLAPYIPDEDIAEPIGD